MKLSPEVVFQPRKTVLEQLFEQFLWKWDGPKFPLLVQIRPCHQPPEDDQNLKRYIFSRKKISHQATMVAAPPPPPNFRWDLKISDQNNWAGPEQNIKFGVS